LYQVMGLMPMRTNMKPILANVRGYRYGLAPMSTSPTPQRSIVVFDLGGVLIDWNPRHLYRKLFADEAEMETFLATVCTQEWNERQDAGRSFSEAAATLCAQHPHHAELIEAFGARFDEMMRGPIEGSVTILETLHERGVPLYALSNWSAETYPLAAKRFEFLKLFRGVIISGEVGVIKPDPRIFRILLERYRIEPNEAVYIDDNPRNAAAARAFGIHGIHFTAPAKLRSELEGLRLL
jgi:2-haloacid dehalogenase